MGNSLYITVTPEDIEGTDVGYINPIICAIKRQLKLPAPNNYGFDYGRGVIHLDTSEGHYYFKISQRLANDLAKITNLGGGYLGNYKQKIKPKGLQPGQYRLTLIEVQT